MMNIMLYGFLGKKFGKVHRYDVKSASEAVKALCATMPGFRKALLDGGAYKVLRGGRELVTLSTFQDPQSSKESLRIVPVIQGAGGGDGLGSVLLGGAMILMAPMTVGTSLAFIGSNLMSVGTSMILGGIAQLLFSAEPVTPTYSSTGVIGTNDNISLDKIPSYAFSGTINTVSQGNPVPVCYGRLVVGSQVISAGMHATP